MATYTNQIPANLVKDDVIQLTASGLYRVLRRITVLMRVTGAQGGTGGGIAMNYGGHQARGGEGGRSAVVSFELEIEAETEIMFSSGTPGNKGADIVVTAEQYGSSDFWSGRSVPNGSDGGITTLAIGGNTIVILQGGKAGKGAVWSYPNSKQGAKGADGTVTLTPQGSLIEPTSTSGAYASLLILSANEPPTAPSYIEYGTPRAGKPLTITVGEATDPD